MFAGFPCQDVSKLNPSAPQNRTVIRDASKRTGTVFNDVLAYFSKLEAGNWPELPKYKSLILENVLGLVERPPGTNPTTGEPWPSNLEYCNHLARRHGLLMLAFTLDPRSFGMPVTRSRVWLICFSEALLQDAHMTEADVQQLAQSVILKVRDAQIRDLDEFLLPLSHPLVQAELQRAKQLHAKRLAAEESRKTSGKTKSAKWPETHARVCDQLGLDWWDSGVPAEDVLRDHPGLLRLTDRQFDFLRMVGVNFPDKRKFCLELSQNQRNTRAARKVVSGRADIITPKGMQLVGHQARCLLGYEGLLLQGIHYGPEHFKLEEQDDDLLRDLAGNAFNSYCCAAIWITKQCVMATLWEAAKVATNGSEDDLFVFRG
ncbi:unnamed protein product [Durusdinium trenchii]|uniref:DNA (cytosine-5-)-methyltransferase n=1 Tax=Durusdinium trenchii TaxID=1381693 RepID=A0ABP0P2G5_9DINO